MKFLVIFLALVVSSQAIGRENIESLSAEHVEYINQLNTTWKAAHNFRGIKIEDLKRLCGSLDVPLSDDADNDISTDLVSSLRSLPESFDARQEWPQCNETISHIRDQGSCGSCWAVSSASAITDRVCIASGGKNKTLLSAQTLTSCCTDCFQTEGCQGGWPIQAFLYWIRHGLVSGGDFGSKDTCSPYLIAPCEHHVEGSRPKCGDIIPTPKCSKKCTNEEIDFESDKNYGKSAFRSGNNVGEIKTELMRRGPMTASFVVYDDFFLYKTGVYQPTEGAKPLGGHAIVVIGWGKENGVNYWLAKNNWNTDWGEQGYFKIKIGVASINKGFVSGIARR